MLHDRLWVVHDLLLRELRIIIWWITSLIHQRGKRVILSLDTRIISYHELVLWDHVLGQKYHEFDEQKNEFDE